MKNTKLNLKKSLKAGFSLIEMLVVIAVIGVIAAIAIPNIGNINDSARDSAGQRNAQACASVYSAGLAAGCDVTGITTVDGALGLLNSGEWKPASGAFKNKVFQVPNLPVSPSDEYTKMTAHLSIDPSSGYLVYNQ